MENTVNEEQKNKYQEEISNLEEKIKNLDAQIKLKQEKERESFDNLHREKNNRFERVKNNKQDSLVNWFLITPVILFTLAGFGVSVFSFASLKFLLGFLVLFPTLLYTLLITYLFKIKECREKFCGVFKNFKEYKKAKKELKNCEYVKSYELDKMQQERENVNSKLKALKRKYNSIVLDEICSSVIENEDQITEILNMSIEDEEELGL